MGTKFYPKPIWRSLLQPAMWQLVRPSTCTISHMTYLINHETCLNNTRGGFYELEQFGGKLFWGKKMNLKLRQCRVGDTSKSR